MQKITLEKSSTDLLHLQKQFSEFFSEIEPNLVHLGNIELAKSNLKEYLVLDEMYSRGENISPGWVSNTRFWLIQNSDRILGTLHLRHKLTPSLELAGGHIGYTIRPCERRKGYGSEILKLGLAKAADLGIQRVLITANKLNTASRKIIESNGGVFANESYDEKEKRVTVRYWVNLYA